MHLFRTKRHIFWLKISALHYIILHLAACAVVISAFVAFLNTDQKLMAWTLIGMGACVWIGLVYRMSAGISKCPLCHSEPMLSKECSKHSNAIRFMGSYRLSVATTTLLRHQFRCPYCGESSRCSLRINKKG